MALLLFEPKSGFLKDPIVEVFREEEGDLSASGLEELGGHSCSLSGLCISEGEESQASPGRLQ